MAGLAPLGRGCVTRQRGLGAPVLSSEDHATGSGRAMQHTSADRVLETLAQLRCDVPDSLFKIEAAGYIRLL
jgi:hypothetical protein